MRPSCAVLPTILALALPIGASAAEPARPPGTDTMAGPQRILSLDTSRAAAPVANDFAVSAGGNLISFCPQLSCVTSPSPDHQRTAHLFAATTGDDGHSEEQTVAILTTIRTGAAKPWTTGAAFTAGDNVQFSAPRNTVYRETAPSCRSAASGAGPTGTGSGIVDGTCRWDWINDQAIDGKVGLYTETAKYAGGGNAWGQANNFQLMPGASVGFEHNTELDFTNDATDCAIGVDCSNLLVVMGGTHKSTAGIEVASNSTGPASSLWGIRISGPALASEADLALDANAKYGIAVNQLGFGGDAFSAATFYDNSTGPVSLLLTGTHALASVDDKSASPVSLMIEGRHSAEAIGDVSDSPATLATRGTKSLAELHLGATAPVGVALVGTYAKAQIAGTGFSVSPAGAVEGLQLGLAKLSAAPAAPGAGRGVLFLVAGTAAGTCRLQVMAGTSTTPTTIADNIGSGC